MLEVTGSSMRSSQSRNQSIDSEKQTHHHNHHHHHHHANNEHTHTRRHHHQPPLKEALDTALSQGENMKSALSKHLAPRITGGLKAMFTALRFMKEDHGLVLGPGEVKDVLISLGCHASSEDAVACFKILRGPKRKLKKDLVLHNVAILLGQHENSLQEDANLGNSGLTDSLKIGGGHNAQILEKLVGITVTRHVKKAIVRSETRQHKGMLSLSTISMLELLRQKMQEHLPPNAGYLETFRLFKHGHGSSISLEEFGHTIRDDFGLSVPEKRLRRLFKYFDTHGNGSIDFGDFVKHVWEGKDKKQPIILRDDMQKEQLKRSLAKAQKRYDNSNVGTLTTDAAVDIVRDKIRQHIQTGQGEVLQAFREFHHGRGKMEITRAEFIDTLKNGLSIKFKRDPQDYNQLFDRFDTDGDGVIDFSEFSHELLEGYEGNQNNGGNYTAPRPNSSHRKVSGTKRQPLLGRNVNIKDMLKTKLLSHLDSGPNEIGRAFNKLKMYSEGKSGKYEGLDLKDFGSAVKRLGILVDQSRIEKLFFHITKTGAERMHIEDFRDSLFGEKYSSSLGLAKHKSQRVSGQGSYSKSQRKLRQLKDETNLREIIRTKLEDKLSGGANSLLKAFRSFHAGHGLEISKEEFHKVINNLLEISMPVEETLLLFNEIDTDGNGTLDYAEFVDEIMSGTKAPILYGKLRRTAIANRRSERKARYSVLNPNTARESRQQINHSRIPTVSPIKRKNASLKTGTSISNQGRKRWKQMKQNFEKQDVQHLGVVTQAQFVNVLSHFGLAVDSNELNKIEKRYGRGENCFSYDSFMRDMYSIMVAKSDKERKLQQKSAVRNAELKTKKQATSPLDEASFILHELITRQWRQLHFSFTQYDSKGRGLLEMRSILGIMSRADPRVGGLIPFLVPKLRESYATPSGLIDFERMIRDHINNHPIKSGSPSGSYSLRNSKASMKTGRASDSKNRPLTWRLNDSLSRAHKASAVVGRIRLQLGSKVQRKEAYTQFQMRDPATTKFVEKSILRSLFARLGVKVSAADVKRLSYCFEVPKQAKFFNYVDFFRVIERGF